MLIKAAAKWQTIMVISQFYLKLVVKLWTIKKKNTQ